MAQVEDITIERTYSGHPAYIKFNYDKYAALLHSFFLQNNIELPCIPNATTMAAIQESKNHQKLKGYDSVDELLSDCLK